MASLRIGLLTIAVVGLCATSQANFLSREEPSGSANHTVTAIAEAKSAIQALAEKANALDAEANSKIGNMSISVPTSASSETVNGATNSSALRGNSVRAAESKAQVQFGNVSDKAEAMQSQKKIQAMGESATPQFLGSKSERKAGEGQAHESKSMSHDVSSAHGLKGAVSADEKVHIAMVQANTAHQHTTSKIGSAATDSSHHTTSGMQGHADEKSTQKSDVTDEITDEIDEVSAAEDLDEDVEGNTETEALDEEAQVSTENPESTDEIAASVDDRESEVSDGTALYQKEAQLFPYASWDESFDSANVATPVAKDPVKGTVVTTSDAPSDKVAPSAKVAVDATAGVEADGEDVDDADTIYLTAGSGTNDGSDDNAGDEEFDSGELSIATEANGMVHDSDDDEHYYDHSMIQSDDGSSDVFDDESSMWGSEWDLGHEEETVETAGDVGEDDEDGDSYDEDYGEEEYDDDPGL